MAENKKQLDKEPLNEIQRIDTGDLELSFDYGKDNKMFISNEYSDKIGDVYDEGGHDITFENFGKLFEEKKIKFNIQPELAKENGDPHYKEYGEYKILRVKWDNGKKYGTFKRQNASGDLYFFKQEEYVCTQSDPDKGLEFRWDANENYHNGWSVLKIYKDGKLLVGEACEFKRNEMNGFKVISTPRVDTREKKIKELGGSFRILFGTSVPSDHLESVEVKFGKKVLKFKKVPVVQSIDDENVYFVPENLVEEAEELEKEFIRKLHEKGFKIPSDDEEAPKLEGGSVYKHEGDETYFIPEKWVEYAQSLENEPSGESDENKTEENEKSGDYTLGWQGGKGRVFPLFNDKNVAGVVVKKGNKYVGYLTEKGRLDKKITSIPKNGGVYSAVMEEQLEGKIKCSFRITNEDKENNVTIDNSEVYTVAQDGTGESWYILKGGKRINEGGNDSVEGALRGRLLSITDKGITVVNSDELSGNVKYRAIGMDTKTTQNVYLEKDLEKAKAKLLQTKGDPLKPINVSNYSMINVYMAKLDNTEKVYEVYRGSKLIGPLYTSGAQNVYNMNQIGTSEEDAIGRVAAKVKEGAPCYYMDDGELKSIPLKEADFRFNELWWNNGKTPDGNSKSNGDMVKDILNYYAKKFGVLLFGQELPIGGYPRGGYYNKFDGESFQALIDLIENEVKNRLGNIKLSTESLLPGSHIIVGKKLEEYDSQRAKTEIAELDGAWEQFYKALEDKFKNESAKNQAAPEQKSDNIEPVQVEVAPQVESAVLGDVKKEIDAQSAEKDAVAEQKGDGNTVSGKTKAEEKPNLKVLSNKSSGEILMWDNWYAKNIWEGISPYSAVLTRFEDLNKEYNDFVDAHNRKKERNYTGLLSDNLAKVWEGEFVKSMSTGTGTIGTIIDKIYYMCEDKDGLWKKILSLLPNQDESGRLMDGYVKEIKGVIDSKTPFKEDELVKVRENVEEISKLISSEIRRLFGIEKEFENKNSIFGKVKGLFGSKSKKRQQSEKNTAPEIKEEVTKVAVEDQLHVEEAGKVSGKGTGDTGAAGEIKKESKETKNKNLGSESKEKTNEEKFKEINEKYDAIYDGYIGFIKDMGFKEEYHKELFPGGPVRMVGAIVEYLVSNISRGYREYFYIENESNEFPDEREKLNRTIKECGKIINKDIEDYENKYKNIEMVVEEFKKVVEENKNTPEKNEEMLKRCQEIKDLYSKYKDEAFERYKTSILVTPESEYEELLNDYVSQEESSVSNLISFMNKHLKKGFKPKSTRSWDGLVNDTKRILDKVKKLETMIEGKVQYSKTDEISEEDLKEFRKKINQKSNIFASLAETFRKKYKKAQKPLQGESLDGSTNMSGLMGEICKAQEENTAAIKKVCEKYNEFLDSIKPEFDRKRSNIEIDKFDRKRSNIEIDNFKWKDSNRSDEPVLFNNIVNLLDCMKRLIEEFNKGKQSIEFKELSDNNLVEYKGEMGSVITRYNAAKEKEEKKKKKEEENKECDYGLTEEDLDDYGLTEEDLDDYGLTEEDLNKYKTNASLMVITLEKIENKFERKILGVLNESLFSDDAMKSRIIDAKVVRSKREQEKEEKRKKKEKKESRNVLEKFGHTVKRGIIKTLRNVPIIGKLPGIKQSDLKKLRNCYKDAAKYVCNCTRTVDGSKLSSKFKPLSSVETYKDWYKRLNELLKVSPSNMFPSTALARLFVSFIGLKSESVVSACEGLKLGGINKKSKDILVKKADTVSNILKNYCKGNFDEGKFKGIIRDSLLKYIYSDPTIINTFMGKFGDLSKAQDTSNTNLKREGSSFINTETMEKSFTDDSKEDLNYSESEESDYSTDSDSEYSDDSEDE